MLGLLLLVLFAAAEVSVGSLLRRRRLGSPKEASEAFASKHELLLEESLWLLLGLLLPLEAVLPSL